MRALLAAALRVAAVGCAGATLGCSLLYSADSLTERPPSQCNPGFVFCDGFENGITPWSLNTGGNGSVTVDGTRSYRGKNSLHTHLPAVTMPGTSAMMANVRPTLTTWPSPAYVRLFVYLPEIPLSAVGFLDLNTAAGAGGTQLYLLGDVGTIALQTFGLANPSSDESGPSMPLNQWTCFEVELDGNNATLWFNDKPTYTLPFPVQIQDIIMDVGISYNTAQANDPAHDAWIDEVAIDDKRVGCAR